MAILLKSVCRSNATTIKISMTFLTEPEEAMPKFILNISRDLEQKRNITFALFIFMKMLYH
jgi:hypothetical protein